MFEPRTAAVDPIRTIDLAVRASGRGGIDLLRRDSTPDWSGIGLDPRFFGTHLTTANQSDA